MIFRITKFFKFGILAINFLFCADFLCAEFSLSWPTPNPAFVQGRGYNSFLQKTGPNKDFTSGAYGCVRNNGYKFHEGVDLFPLRKDKQGKPLDSIFSAMSGNVVYINYDESKSSYGKYVVLEHPAYVPKLYTLYGHLDSFSEGLSVGKKINVSEAIGKMGNSSSFAIPISRAHLHFEIGFRLSENFQGWYDRKNFNTANHHGNFNGYNLVGIDPLDFYKLYQGGHLKSPSDFFNRLKRIVRVRVKSKIPPAILEINPNLCPINIPKDNPPQSWICSFGPHGIPLAFEPSLELAQKNIEILAYSPLEGAGNCRKLVDRKKSSLTPSEQLVTYIEILFSR